LLCLLVRLTIDLSAGTGGATRAPFKPAPLWYARNVSIRWDET